MDLIMKHSDLLCREYCDVALNDQPSVREMVNRIVEYYKTNGMTGSIDVRKNLCVIASLGGAYYTQGTLHTYIPEDVIGYTVDNVTAVRMFAERRCDFTINV